MYVAGIVLTLRLQSFRYSRKWHIWERNVIPARCWWTILNFRIQTIRFDFHSNLWDILKLWWKEANIDWRDIFRFEEDGEKNRDSRDCCDRLYFSKENYSSFKSVLFIAAFSALVLCSSIMKEILNPF